MPSLGALPFLLREPSLDVGEGPRQREDSLGDRTVRVLGREPFHPVGIRFVHRELGPFIPGDFVALDPLVAWTPPNLDPDAGFLGSKGGDVPSGLEGVVCPGPVSSEAILPMAALQSVRMVTSPSVWFLAAATCRALASRTLGVIGSLAPAQVGLVALPRVAILPGDGVSGCSVLQLRPIREDRQPWPVGSLGLVCRCLCFLDGGGRLQRGGYLEEDRFFPSVPHPRWDWSHWPSSLSAAPMSSMA